MERQHQLYGLIFPQMYVDAAYNDLTVRMGHCAPSIGYEVVAAPGNFFYTHSYALGYSEPVLVTGFGPIISCRTSGTSSAASTRATMVFADANARSISSAAEVAQRRDEKSLSFMIDTGNQELAGLPSCTTTRWSSSNSSARNWLYAFERVLGGERNPGQRRFRPVVRPGPVPHLHDQPLLVGRHAGWNCSATRGGVTVAGMGNLNYGWIGDPGLQRHVHARPVSV